MRAAINFRGTPIRPLSSRSIALTLISLLSLGGSSVRGQQSYIPWTGRPDMEAGTAPGRDGGVEKTRQAAQPEADRSIGGSRPGNSDAAESLIDAFNDGPIIHDGFANRLFDAYFLEKEDAEESEPSRRPGVESPFSSPPFPFAEFIGPYVGYRDTSAYPLMDAIYHGPNGDWWKKSGIKIYGWADPSYNASTSRNSNYPQSYALVPNHIELSQAVLIFERVTDSVQTDHMDWGFKLTNLYGIDYRFTTAKGYFSDQLLKHNRLYGYDPLQMYVDLYIPWIREGTIIRAGPLHRAAGYRSPAFARQLSVHALLDEHIRSIYVDGHPVQHAAQRTMARSGRRARRRRHGTVDDVVTAEWYADAEMGVR